MLKILLIYYDHVILRIYSSFTLVNYSLGTDSFKWKDENCNKQNTFFCELPKLCMPEKCKTKKSSAAKGKFLQSCSPKSCSFCSDVS
jgi:hypothetical protein